MAMLSRQEKIREDAYPARRIGSGGSGCLARTASGSAVGRCRLAAEQFFLPLLLAEAYQYEVGADEQRALDELPFRRK